MSISRVIFLLRHAEYANPRAINPGRLPVELSKRGRAQAERMGQYLQAQGVEQLYSSAVLRCKQTCQIISDTTIPIHFDQRLLETFSAYQGISKAEESADPVDFYAHRHELGGESLEQVQERMIAFWQEMWSLDQKQQPTIGAICSHGDPLFALSLYLLKKKLPDEQKPKSQSPDYLPMAGVRKVTLEANGNLTFGPIQSF